MSEIYLTNDPSMTLVEWKFWIEELIYKYGNTAILQTDGGANNVSMNLIEAKKSSKLYRVYVEENYHGNIVRGRSLGKVTAEDEKSALKAAELSYPNALNGPANLYFVVQEMT